MEIKFFYSKGISHYSYVVLTQKGLVVIDPKRDVEDYLKVSRETGLPIKYILLTHCHADFIAGHIRLAELTGAKIIAGKGMSAGYELQELAEGDVIELGEAKFVVMETPGHTPEHVSYVVYDKDVSESEPLAVFTGDSLFAGDVGRPDLFGPEMQEQLTASLFETVQKHKGLPDGILVYPAHGAGSFCGKRISNRCPTSLGYEKKINPLYGIETLEEFKTVLFASMPTPPAYYFKISKRNRTGEGLEKTMPALQGVGVKDLLNFDGIIVDLRDQTCFASMFIPGSLNIASDIHFAIGVGFVVDPDDNIVLVGDGVEDVYLTLYRMGYDNVRGFLFGGIEAWRNAALPVKSFKYIDPKLCYDLVQKGEAVLVDVRSESEFASERVPFAVNMPLASLKERMGELPKDKLIVLQCGHGCRGSLAASILEKEGFDNVANLAGGLIAWKSRNLPVDNK
ncbi:MBL fold metallo-hydrolase [Thermosulfidibacter takaii]|nr:MBL fold metallo-hydrolase [Thermosulfidibacter takaii]